MGHLEVWSSLIVNDGGSKVSPGLYLILALPPWTDNIRSLSLHLFIAKISKMTALTLMD